MILSTHLGLSYKCNMRCNHCFVTEKKDDYVVRHYKEIIDELIGLGVMEIHYTYGEPLLCKEFFQVAQYCKKRGIGQTLMSNGYFIDSTVIVEKIKKVGIKRVFISLDSVFEQQHDCNRNCKYAYKKAINAIRLLKDAGIFVGIANSISEKNIEEMLKMYELGEELKVNLISFLRIRESKGISCFSNQKLGKYQEYVKELILQAKKGVVQVSFHDPFLRKLIEEMIKTGQIEKGVEAEKYRVMSECSMPYSLSIAPSGEVSKCALSNYIIGNVSDCNWKENIEKDFTYLCLR